MSQLGKLRSQDGQSTLELAGTIVWIVLAGLFAFQLAVVGWTAVSAGNAARTAARLVSRGDSESDARKAEVQMLAGRGLGNATVTFPSSVGDKAEVHVPVPPVFPGISIVIPHFGITQDADMPPTG
jgi:Flp pilus assembly protein TadG